MIRITCLLLFFSCCGFAQLSGAPTAPLPDTCTLTLNATVMVSGVSHTFWMSFSGSCKTLTRIWRRLVTEFVPPFLESVLALFPGQQPQIVTWWISWG